jgi:DNA-binding NarL/FixJ family response regulator
MPANGDSAFRRAIVIDDEPEIAVLVAEALRNAGFVCDVASGGREGQAMISARAGGYDAVVCDLRMPDMDGPALFSLARDASSAARGAHLVRDRGCTRTRSGALSRPEQLAGAREAVSAGRCCAARRRICPARLAARQEKYLRRAAQRADLRPPRNN